MYWPAWNFIGRSSFNQMPLIVGVRSSMRVTTPVKSRTGRLRESSSISMSASMTVSDSSVAQQARHRPSLRSESISAKPVARPWSTSPSRTRILQVAQ